MFVAAIGKQLHADADAEKRPALSSDGLIQRLDHPGDGIEAAPAIGNAPTPGKNNPLGARDNIRIGGDVDAGSRSGFARGALKSLGGGVKIAGTVIDDGDAHRPAPGCGNRAKRQFLGAGRIDDRTAETGHGRFGDRRLAAIGPLQKEAPLRFLDVIRDDRPGLTPFAPRQGPALQTGRFQSAENGDQKRAPEPDRRRCTDELEK